MEIKAGLRKICESYGKSRQGYYKRERIEQKREEERRKILRAVYVIRFKQPKVGVKKLHRMLRVKGVEVGRDRLYEVMREEGLIIKRKRSKRTTNSNHGFRKYKNLIKGKEIRGAEEVFVSDITYILTRERYTYLSLITDIWSRKIVGYCLSISLSVEGSIKALKMALRGRKKGIIHHSDRGIQYCCNAYVDILEKHGAKISMTEENHVYENALAERVNGILKDEFMLGQELPSYETAKKIVKEAIETYNNERIHMSIEYKTPAQKHAEMVEV